MIEKNRKRMIENGTYDDYTITRNNIELIKNAGHFLENLFGKKLKIIFTIFDFIKINKK